MYPMKKIFLLDFKQNAVLINEARKIDEFPCYLDFEKQVVLITTRHLAAYFKMQTEDSDQQSETQPKNCWINAEFLSVLSTNYPHLLFDGTKFLSDSGEVFAVPIKDGGGDIDWSDFDYPGLPQSTLPVEAIDCLKAASTFVGEKDFEGIVLSTDGSILATNRKFVYEAKVDGLTLSAPIILPPMCCQYLDGVTDIKVAVSPEKDKTYLILQGGQTVLCFLSRVNQESLFFMLKPEFKAFYTHDTGVEIQRDDLIRFMPVLKYFSESKNGKVDLLGIKLGKNLITLTVKNGTYAEKHLPYADGEHPEFEDYEFTTTVWGIAKLLSRMTDPVIRIRISSDPSKPVFDFIGKINDKVHVASTKFKST